MISRLLMTGLAAGLVTTVLTGCASFAPVYGGHAGGGAHSVRFNFASPDSRLEQIIFDRLKVAFPGPALPGDPVLDLVVTRSTPAGSNSDAYAVARPVNVRIEATVTIARDGEPVFEAKRFADTAYQGGKLASTNAISNLEAERTAAEGVAESLRLALLAFSANGNPI
ncbi:hypothetical protein [Devosia sediminis]|uniref:LPS-assembly lipoprotein n=1 Tax=Devosia sediminis TaxID=2798801 RepID=A0A934IQN0_9HYPH|nr:hypothetical protein [Devosia sediminis]MBJ3785049.1 hypothetical protein [Devosia sediminis]